MRHATTQRIRRSRGVLELLRFYAAIIFALAAIAAACFVFTRDIGWPARSREARRRAHAAEADGDYLRARSAYEAALSGNPYDWETSLELANLLNHRLGLRADALRHYLRALAYSPDPSIIPETEAKIRILRLLRAGELEDPRDALEDMFTAAESGAKALFLRRLDRESRLEGEQRFREWRGRERGRTVLGRIEEDRNGRYEAMLDVHYPDGTEMPVRMRCLPRDVWRVIL